MRKCWLEFKWSPYLFFNWLVNPFLLRDFTSYSAMRLNNDVVTWRKSKMYTCTSCVNLFHAQVERLLWWIECWCPPVCAGLAVVDSDILQSTIIRPGSRVNVRVERHDLYLVLVVAIFITLESKQHVHFEWNKTYHSEEENVISSRRMNKGEELWSFI